MLSAGVRVTQLRPWQEETGQGQRRHWSCGQSLSVTHSAAGGMGAQRPQQSPGEVTSWLPSGHTTAAQSTAAQRGSGPTQVGQQLPPTLARR